MSHLSLLFVAVFCAALLTQRVFAYDCFDFCINHCVGGYYECRSSCMGRCGRRDDDDLFLKTIKKGLKGYNTYKKYRGMIGGDDNIEQIDPELSVTGTYNNGPFSVSASHNFDDDDLFLKKLKKVAKKGLKAYSTYKKYGSMIPADDDQYRPANGYNCYKSCMAYCHGGVYTCKSECVKQCS